MKAGTKVRIVSIHKDDAHYEEPGLVGSEGVIRPYDCGFRHRDKRHHACLIALDNQEAVYCFHKVKLERI